MMTGVSLCITPAKAQFNTVAVTPTRYKMEVLDMGVDQAEPASESEISVQEVSTGIPVSADMDKKKWMDRYLSVSYTRYVISRSLRLMATVRTRLRERVNFMADWTCAHVATR